MDQETTRDPGSARARLAVLTSGGDAPGMNAAVRAVVRAGIHAGGTVYAVHEGYRGLVEGGPMIREMDWNAVGGILHQGGTAIGTARSPEFRERAGRRAAAANLLVNGIDRLIVIGGDGSLTGADAFRREWPDLLAELVAAGDIAPELAAAHPTLHVVGLVGSIDNDMVGIDMTIGADSALHRITDAIDAISSTAASHQRTFVVEVMGRHCGYLALRGALAGSADWVFVPEDPPAPGWEEHLCTTLRTGRESGRRDSIVVVAEGAIDRAGQPITSEHVQRALEEGLGEDVRVTVLGHVQRGGSPSAFDRYMSTVLGAAAVEDVLASTAADEPHIVGLKNNRTVRVPLMAAVEDTHAIAAAAAAGRFDEVLERRGGGFRESLVRQRILNQVFPGASRPSAHPRTIAVLHAGGLAPGMNAAARAVARFALDRGHRVLGFQDGFVGLAAGERRELEWITVNGWGTTGGAELGTTRHDLTEDDLVRIAGTVEREGIDTLVMIGGWSGYQACHELVTARHRLPGLDVSVLAVPATIDNDLPGTDLTIGSDSALNSITEAVDKIKQSAVASSRCFVVEVMGGRCGYLALAAGLATGAERVFLPEEGVTLADLQEELVHMRTGFAQGKRVELVIRNEFANAVYTADFMARLFEEEGGPEFSVRQATLGHLQVGGAPSPFDRILAVRLASRVVDHLETQPPSSPITRFIGVEEGQVAFTDFADFPRLVDMEHHRARRQWWRGPLRPIADTMAHEPTRADDHRLRATTRNSGDSVVGAPSP